MSSEWETIPQELRDIPQWVCWKLEDRDGKPTKIPINAKNGNMASTTNPKTWSTYVQARRTAMGNDLDGIGFVFTKDDPYVGIDMDGFIDKDLIEWFGSYAELSQSGRGCHIIVKGDIPESRRSDKFEVYKAERYFVMTGRRINDNPIIDGGDKLREFMDSQFMPAAKPKTDTGKQTGGTTYVRAGGKYDPVELLRRTNGLDFEMLWSGDTSGHGNDHSAADLALCNYLHWACGGDRQWTDTLFRQSGLMRPKWERADYRGWTLDKAAEQADVYIPPCEVDLSAIMPKTGKTDKKPAEKPKLDVSDLFHGTIIGELVPIFSSVTNPPLPLELVLPKVLCLVGSALSGMVEACEEGDKGVDLAKVRIGGEGIGIPPTFYCVTVAESATGKDVGNVLERVAPKDMLLGCGSAEGIQDLLSEAADTARRNPLILLNEMRDFLNPKHWKSQAAEFLTSLYSKLCFSIPMSSRSKNSAPRESRYCAVSLLGNVQPGIFAKAGSELDDLGMIGRCLFFVHDGHRLHHPDRRYHLTKPIRYKCQTMLQNLANVKGVYHYDETRIRQVMDSYHAKGKSTPRHRRYMNEYVPKLAFLLGISPIGEVTHGHEIPQRNIDKAIMAIDHFYNQAQELVDKLRLDSKELDRINKLDKLAAFISRNKEGVAYGKLANQFKGWDQKTLIDLLSSLENQGRVSKHKGEKGGNIFKVEEVEDK